MLGAADKLSHNPAPEGGRKGRIQPRGRDSAYCEPFPGFGETPNLTPWTKAIIPRRFGGSPGPQPAKRCWRVRSVVRLGVLFAPNSDHDGGRVIGCRIRGPFVRSGRWFASPLRLLQPVVRFPPSFAPAGGLLRWEVPKRLEAREQFGLARTREPLAQGEGDDTGGTGGGGAEMRRVQPVEGLEGRLGSAGRRTGGGSRQRSSRVTIRTSNSPGLKGAKPTWTFRRPEAMSSGVWVLESHRTK
jgi:hypothetical protein